MANSKNSLSTKGLIEHVALFLGRYIRAGQHLAVAYSGGLDSSVLLDILVRLRDAGHGFTLSAVHVNHGLSPHADAWVAHCQRVCNRNGVPLHTLNVTVCPSSGGLESAARDARYRALLAIHHLDWILLGQHQTDQAETLMLNLLRGASVYGASAMPVVRDRLLRPLLQYSRQNLVTYADAHALTWVEDESNRDNSLSRNFLRNSVFPLLSARYPAAEVSLARAAESFAEQATLSEALARADMGTVSRLTIESLRRLDHPRAKNLLAWYLRWFGLRIPSRMLLEELLRQLMTARTDATVAVCIDRHEVRGFRGEVWVTPMEESREPTPVKFGHDFRLPLSCAWGREKVLIRAVDSGGAVSDLLQLSLELRGRAGGERIQLNASSPRRSLKNILREYGVPPWVRDRLPLLFCGTDLVWVPGVGIDVKYQNCTESPGLALEFSGVTW